MLFSNNCDLYALDNNSPKQPKKANTFVGFALGFSATTVPVALGVFKKNDFYVGSPKYMILPMAGLIFGPSLGKIYARDKIGAMKGIGFRTASGAIALALLNQKHKTDIIILSGGVISSGVLVYSVVWDLMTTPSSVYRHNKNISGISYLPIFNPYEKFLGIKLEANFR